eukprot:15094055-Ditylum_brightwellii.AAC.1
MAWLQIQAKSECLTGFSDDLTFANDEEEDNNDDDDNKEEDLQDLRTTKMAQTIPTMSSPRRKVVIELVNEESDSKSDRSESAFKKRPFKKAKKVK